MELLADFQRFYGVRVDELIDKDPVRVEYLIRGLIYNPKSLYRAQYLRGNPSSRAAASRVMDWFEWGPTLSILVQILNTMIVKDGGRAALSRTLKPPTERIVVRGGDVSAMNAALKTHGAGGGTA